MAENYISPALRRKIAQDAQYRCGYCLTVQEFTAMPMHIEHIVPVVAGGLTAEKNLWLSCPLCNGHKAAKTEGVDPDTGLVIPLFNPRQQSWPDHFRWSEDGVWIIGRTAVGRATVIALQLNNAHFVTARKRWVLAGWHPPT